MQQYLNTSYGQELREVAAGKGLDIYERDGRMIAHPSNVTSPGCSPVVIEAEYSPARSVEPEARERIGMDVTGQARPIEAAIALRYPEAVGDADDLLTDICLFSCIQRDASIQ